MERKFDAAYMTCSSAHADHMSDNNMAERIVKLLKEEKSIHGWRITETRTLSRELFLIKREIDMYRSKNVHTFEVTLYKDFAENGQSFRGSSSFRVHPTMTDGEIRDLIAGTAYAAGFVKNEYYPLPSPAPESALNFRTCPESGVELTDKAALDIAHTLFQCENSFKRCDGSFNGGADTAMYPANGFSSAEIFTEIVFKRIINSEGVDICWSMPGQEIEFITNWKGEDEEVELYRNMKSSALKSGDIENAAMEMLKACMDKAAAKPTPALSDIPVLLTGEPVREFLRYYLIKSCTKSVYEKTSSARPGESIQGRSIKGDRISLHLEPCLSGSTYSAPCDEDGFVLEPQAIIEDGILKKLWGPLRYCHYLKVPATGNIQNTVFSCGTRTAGQLREEPHLEILSFSDFKMDTLTGDFAGEIRLGWYFDGSKTCPVTGGSVSGNIVDVQEEMYFSKEMQQENNFVGPKSILLRNVNIAGG